MRNAILFLSLFLVAAPALKAQHGILFVNHSSGCLYVLNTSNTKQRIRPYKADIVLCSRPDSLHIAFTSIRYSKGKAIHTPVCVRYPLHSNNIGLIAEKEKGTWLFSVITDASKQ